MFDVRCSSLPLAFICPGSAQAIDLQIDHTGEPAGVGTAVHRALAPLSEGMSPQSALDVALDMYRNVDPLEVRRLFWAGVRMWQKLSDARPNAKAEIELKATISDGQHKVQLTGHLDVLAVNRIARRAIVDDWKSGRLDHDFHHQGFGYAALVMLNDADIDEVEVNFLWLRTEEIEPYTVTRERMNQWLEELMADVVKWDGRYHDGPHCGHCHRNHDCPAATAMIRRDVAMFSDDGKRDVQAMDAPTFCAYWRKLKMLETMVEEAREHARIEVDRRGGEVYDGDGGLIHFVEQNGPREIDWPKAKPVVEKLLIESEYVSAFDVSAKKLDDLVAIKAGKGKGAAARRNLAKALEDAGAVTHSTQRKLIEERER